MLKIVTSEQMSNLEQRAFSSSLRDLADEFMENAGRGIFSAIKARFKTKIHVLILCAHGNNSGDAYVVGRHLLQDGYTVSALQLAQPKSALCKKKCELFKNAGGEIFTSRDGIQNFQCVIDGLFGTGFEGDLTGVYLDCVTWINSLRNVFLASIDIPSGVHGTKGIAPNKTAIRAHITYALELPKLGFFLGDAKNFVGKVHVISFGLETKWIDAVQTPFSFLEAKDFQDRFPRLPNIVHKYEKGHLAILAGSLGMIGACALSSHAAMRSGAGFVKAYHDTKLNYQSILPIETVKQEIDWSFDSQTDLLTSLAKKINQAKAFLVGPGLGVTYPIQKLLPHIQIPTLIDADALNFFAKTEFKIPKHCVFTPHFGEMARLLKHDCERTLESFERCQHYAKDHRVSLVLKGPNTMIFSSTQNQVYVSDFGDPGMATAGSGDVLSGIISSFLSKGMNCEDASICGVILHGLAGELAAQEFGSQSLMASDIIAKLSHGFKILET